MSTIYVYNLLKEALDTSLVHPEDIRHRLAVMFCHTLSAIDVSMFPTKSTQKKYKKIIKDITRYSINWNPRYPWGTIEHTLLHSKIRKTTCIHVMEEVILLKDEMEEFIHNTGVALCQH